MLSSSEELAAVVAAAAAGGGEIGIKCDFGDGYYGDQKPPIHLKIYKLFCCYRISHFEHLWFSCDTYKHSQISPCISLEFD